MFVEQWTSNQPLDQVAKKLIACTLEIRTHYAKLIKSQSNKTLLTFNVRHLFRIMHSFVSFCPDNIYYLNENDLFRFWNSEVNRTFTDRIPEVENRLMFNVDLHLIAINHFKYMAAEAKNL